MAGAHDTKSETVTSPYAPDVDAVRVWLEDMVAAMSFARLIAAILTLITRMRDLNTELTKRVAHLTRKRPRSETLERLERQLPLKFQKDAETTATPAPELVPAPEKKLPRSRRGRHPGRGALAAHLPRVPDVSRVTPERRICPLCGLGVCREKVSRKISATMRGPDRAEDLMPTPRPCSALRACARPAPPKSPASPAQGGVRTAAQAARGKPASAPRARKSFRTLCVRAMMLNSALAASSPRKSRRLSPRASLIWPKTGSTIALRLL